MPTTDRVMATASYQLDTDVLAALDAISRRSGLRSRAAALRVVARLGVEEWERRNGPLDSRPAARRRAWQTTT